MKLTSISSRLRSMQKIPNYKDHRVVICGRCSSDYVDVYTQVREPFQDLLDVPLHGRYCGSDISLLPYRFVSMHHVFVVGFYTDHQKDERGFSAEYSFVDGCKLNE
jgi:hypothetical protein